MCVPDTKHCAMQARKCKEEMNHKSAVESSRQRFREVYA
jgi:hypothetical protein